MNAPAALPHWNLDSIYPGLESPQFEQGMVALKGNIAALETAMQAQGITRGATSVPSPKSAAERVEMFLGAMNANAMAFETIKTYITGFVTTDSFNTLARRRLSELELLGVQLETQQTRFTGWLGEALSPSGALERVTGLSASASEHAFFLRETLEQSRFLMSQAQEDLAAELLITAGNAWENLQNTVTSQVAVLFAEAGEPKEMPVTALRNIAWYHPDEAVRRRAFEAEVRAWESVREPLAAALNGVKGTANILARRRGRPDALHASLEQARLERATLETMLGVMRESFPMFRRYFAAKARHLGKTQMDWWDLFAPVGAMDKRYTFGEARDFILGRFATFSPRLEGLARRAFDEGWIDAEPRKGKVGGAFCAEVPGLEQSRILANFDGSFDQVQTLAHELGHAFHNECLAGLTMIQRKTPMTLAETASIFNETLVTEAALAGAPGGEEQLAILDSFMVNASQIVVDIYSRYLFESEVFARRAHSELSADDFCEIMTRCQRETYGEGLNAEHLHPYMWAWKPHYYSATLSFYNFPYAFGLLFGLGLYAEFQRRGSAFATDYEALLRATGSGTAEELAARHGIDLRSPEFWRASMRLIETRLERYLAL
jgi:pepF/M3 family oligoendopeptidase